MTMEFCHFLFLPWLALHREGILVEKTAGQMTGDDTQGLEDGR